VDALRTIYGNDIDLEKWLAMDDNVYVGRAGRIFIGAGKTKKRFAYQQSKWANPYPVGDKWSLDESIDLYRKHLVSTGLVNEVGELRGLCLGCFCDQAAGKKCHAKELARLADAGN
jgi:hypothetical protein